tara:strand:+ start:854 stop:1120 length:267 start_codon:yes stop_codon:yes gene_type:complete
MKNYYQILGVDINDNINIIKEKTKRNLQNVEINSQQFNQMKKAYNKSQYYSSSYSSSMTNNNGEKEVYFNWESNNNGKKKSSKKHFKF